MTRIAALVPMRHHSQRVPGKNYRPLAGKPLFHHIIETLLAVPEIETVLVDTDSEPVIEGLRAHFPQVKIIERPAHLRADDVPMNDILLHDTAQFEADFYLQTHSTNPLLKSQTISKAIQLLTLAPGAHLPRVQVPGSAGVTNYPNYDSLFSVTRLQTRLYDRDGRAINHNPRELLQTQDLPPVYEENSCLYIFTRASLVKNHHRIGDRPLMFEIPRLEAIDIDEESDFVIADILMSRRQTSEGK